MESKEEVPRLYPFYHANIHEKRYAATVARCAPLTINIILVVVMVIGMFWSIKLFLSVCAALNVIVWLFLVSSCLSVLIICRLYEVPFPKALRPHEAEVSESSVDEAGNIELRHMLVIPNYKEDIECLKQTLTAISEADGHEKFIVVLACEEREGSGAKEKVWSLQTEFKGSFSSLTATYHPPDLQQDHNDGSSDPEVAGKASNVKWAVHKGYKMCKHELGLDIEHMMLTVLDADVIFHPCYFQSLSEEVSKLRAASDDDSYKWTMWQAPQIQGRNFGNAYAPARVWGIAQVIFEFGGVASLALGGHHMVFSSYSVPLTLAHDGSLWDGDVIAEDHHAFLKAFFYSIWAKASEALENGQAAGSSPPRLRPPVRVKALMLPSKSTAVETSNGWWENWCARWDQSKRHSRGVSELCYFFLATYDMFSVMPWSMVSINLIVSIFRVAWHLMLLHVFMIGQGVGLALLSLNWMLHHGHVSYCPENIWYTRDGHTQRPEAQDVLLCSLAGAWSLLWPFLIPYLVAVLANYSAMCTYFIAPTEAKTQLQKLKGKAAAASAKQSLSAKLAASLPTWYIEDGNLSYSCGSRLLTLRVRTFVDVIILGFPIIFLFVFTAEILGMVEVIRLGNQFTYITAARVTGPSYGATRSIAAEA